MRKLHITETCLQKNLSDSFLPETWLVKPVTILNSGDKFMQTLSEKFEVENTIIPHYRISYFVIFFKFTVPPLFWNFGKRMGELVQPYHLIAQTIPRFANWLTFTKWKYDVWYQRFQVHSMSRQQPTITSFQVDILSIVFCPTFKKTVL